MIGIYFFNFASSGCEPEGGGGYSRVWTLSVYGPYRYVRRLRLLFTPSWQLHKTLISEFVQFLKTLLSLEIRISLKIWLKVQFLNLKFGQILLPRASNWAGKKISSLRPKIWQMSSLLAPIFDPSVHTILPK